MRLYSEMPEIACFLKCNFDNIATAQRETFVRPRCQTRPLIHFYASSQVIDNAGAPPVASFSPFSARKHFDIICCWLCLHNMQIAAGRAQGRTQIPAVSNRQSAVSWEHAKGRRSASTSRKFLNLWLIPLCSSKANFEESYILNVKQGSAKMSTSLIYDT